VGSLHAVDPEWGIKYGMGFSTIFGSDGKYNLHYDLASVTNDVEAYYGYLDMRSQAAHPGTSYQIGAYYARHLREGKDEYIIDCRFTGSLYNLGDASTKPDFKLQSLMISL